MIANAQVAESVVAYARNHNLAKIVIGRDPERRLWPWQRSSGQKLALLAPDIDLVEIGRASGPRAERPGARPAPRRRGVRRAAQGQVCCATCGRRSPASRSRWDRLPLAAHFDRSNIVAIFILTVVLVAVRFGRGPAALAAVLSVGAFDFFFVPPRFSFAVSDVQYFLTFVIMLAVGLITGQLTAGLRFQARVSAHREERAASLYEFARDLSGAVQVDQVVKISDESIERTFHAAAALLLPDSKGQLTEAAAARQTLDAGDRHRSVGVRSGPAGRFRHRYAAGERGALRSAARAHPIARRARGQGPQPPLAAHPEQRQLLDTFAALIAIALERVHYVGLAQDALVRMESERLRNSLLAALSHDLRTPLTVLVGLAESLALTKPPLSPAQAGDRRCHEGRGAAHEHAGQQPVGDGAHRKRRCEAQSAVAAARGGGRRGVAIRRAACSSTTRSTCACRAICRWCASTPC